MSTTITKPRLAKSARMARPSFSYRGCVRMLRSKAISQLHPDITALVKKVSSLEKQVRELKSNARMPAARDNFKVDTKVSASVPVAVKNDPYPCDPSSPEFTTLLLKSFAEGKRKALDEMEQTTAARK